MTFIAAGSSLAATVGLTGLVGATAGGIIGTGLVAGAAGAGLGAITSAATGQDVGKGALMGGVTGLVGGGALSGLGALGAGTLVAGGAAGAAGGAAGAAAGGEDVGKGALVGGALGTAGGALEGLSSANAADEELVSASNQATKAASSLDKGIAAGVPTASQVEGNTIAQKGLTSAAEAASKVSPPVAESSSFLPKIITDNPKTSLGALAVGGAYLMSQKNQGLMTNQAPTASIYAPTPYTQADIPRTTVPKYYQYADGGIVPPQAQQQPTQPQQPQQPQQPAQPMNKFAQMGLDMAQQRIQQAQAQQIQAQQPQQAQPQAGIPVAPTQMQPQQQFADGGLTEGMAGKHEDFMQQVQTAAQQLSAQQLATQRAPGSQTAQAVTPVQPVAPVAVQRAATGGIMKDNLGGYSHGGIAGLTSAVGSGVSDDIPAQIGTSGKQPARLAANEFVIPARIVSELGQGSSEAGGKILQGMVNRVQARRKKSIGIGKVAVDSKAMKELPA